MPSVALNRQGMAELRPVPINASTVMRDPQIWVPLPAARGQYVVQVRVMDGDLASGNQKTGVSLQSRFHARQRWPRYFVRIVQFWLSGWLREPPVPASAGVGRQRAARR
jgi:hypothetical protein